jgi:hypothetical protein
MIRSQLADFGIVLAKGIQHALILFERLLDGEALDIPALAARVLIIRLAPRRSELGQNSPSAACLSHVRSRG